MRYLVLLLLFFAPGIVCAQSTIAGIGAQLIIDSSGGYTMPRIFSLVQNSPADQSLHATDYIIKVDGISCRNKNLQEIVAMIRGEEGTKVKITTASSKDGKDAKDTLLTRVSMQVAGQDPTTVFYADCENEVKQLKKNKAEVVKTFNSECGNYFFNFNAESGAYHVRVISMEEKMGGVASMSFGSAAKVYDNDNEAGAAELTKTGSTDKGLYLAAQLDGSITFKKSCVGTISIHIQDDSKKCKGMYIIVYK